MAKIKCTLPNASEEINGIKFAAEDGAMVSEDIGDDVAAGFLTIPGYELVAAEAAKPTKPEGKADGKQSATGK